MSDPTGEIGIWFAPDYDEDKLEGLYMTTTKLTPEQVAEIDNRWPALPRPVHQDCSKFTHDVPCDCGFATRMANFINREVTRRDIAALLADRASLVAELKSREKEAMDFAKYVIDDFQRTGSVGPLAVLYESFRTPPTGN